MFSNFERLIFLKYSWLQTSLFTIVQLCVIIYIRKKNTLKSLQLFIYLTVESLSIFCVFKLTVKASFFLNKYKEEKYAKPVSKIVKKFN